MTRRAASNPDRPPRVRRGGSDLCRLGPIALLLLLRVPVAPADEAWQAEAPAPVPVEQLIEQLGSAEYSQREKARLALSELGVEAFDALLDAQLHEDMEVRKQAEYLVRAIREAWVRAEDPPAVRELLRDYQSEGLEERESDLQRLAGLASGVALEPLCRLARFETSEYLSKRAALWAMSYPLPEPTVETESWSERIRQAVGSSRRTSAEWLRVYARYLEDPRSTDKDWDRLADAEAEALQLRPDKLRLGLLRDFLRWQVDLWEKQGDRDKAIAVMRRTLDLQQASQVDLLDTADWLLQRSAWPLIDALAEQFSEAFNQDPHLLYRRAESCRRQGQTAAAEELAAQARKTQVSEEPFLHVELGRDLQKRGFVDWAEQEYRQAIQSIEEGTHPNLEARVRLGWLLADWSRYDESYTVLREAVRQMDRDTQVVRRLQELQRDPELIRGQMYLSRAKALHEKRQFDEERTQLEQALSHDAFNADILIAMHRIPEGSEDWRQRTQQRIDAVADRFRSAILIADRNYQAAPSEENKVRLALMLNQFAWLAANTDGDLPAALESSLRSLELMPDDPGYLDTLARCYYAVGELEQAVKHQRRAVEQEPGSGQIRLQLKLFEQALREQLTDSAGGSPASVEADSQASPSVPQGASRESP